MKASITKHNPTVERRNLKPLTIFTHDPGGDYGIFIALGKWKGEFLYIDESGDICQSSPDAQCYVFGSLNLDLTQ